MLYLRTALSFHFIKNWLAHCKRNSSNGIKYILCGQSGDLAVNQTFMLLDCDKAHNDFSGKQTKGNIVRHISMNYFALSVFWLYSSVSTVYFFPYHVH